jgi:hypothetical protein
LIDCRLYVTDRLRTSMAIPIACQTHQLQLSISGPMARYRRRTASTIVRNYQPRMVRQPIPQKYRINGDAPARSSPQGGDYV